MKTQLIMVGNAFGMIAFGYLFWDMPSAYLFNEGTSIPGMATLISLGSLFMVFDLSNFSEKIQLKDLIKGAGLAPFWLIARLFLIK